MNNYEFRQLLAQKLISLRKENKLFQKDVAKVLGIDQPVYASYEQGRAEPSIRMLQILRKFYGLQNIDEMIEFVK